MDLQLISTIEKNGVRGRADVAAFRARRLWLLFFASVMAAVFILCRAVTAQAYGLTQCAGDRFGSNLVCTAQDVSITNIQVVSGSQSSCIGGSTITLDLDLTVNFATPDRWDIGVFITNDGNDPQKLPASGGATSCSVGILPTSAPFLDLDGVPKGTADTCGDGNGAINGGTGTGIMRMSGVNIRCQAISGSTGNLYIPFVVSWDNQSSPTGKLCTTAADPVPNTKSKCNAPLVTQGTVGVVVLPSITKADGISIITPGDSTTYTVVITNTTGDTLSNAVFKDPAVADLTANSVGCSAAGGATCPATTVAAMQGAGITIPPMPVNSSVTFTIGATLSPSSPTGTLTNSATVTVAGQTASASDTNTIANKPTVTVMKLSSGGTGSFSFSGTNGVGNFTLDTSAVNPQTSSTYTATSVNTLTTITETVPFGWALSSASCTDGTSTFGTLSGGTLTIPAADMGYDKVITCTFTNENVLPNITIMKSAQTLSDPVNGATNPKAIPGAEMLYRLTVTNFGNGAADNDSVVIVDPIPADTALVVSGVPIGFSDGTPASGLAFTWGGLADPVDDVQFSSNGGATYAYIPTAGPDGADPAVTNLRINPKGIFAASSGGNNPNFSLTFKVIIK